VIAPWPILLNVALRTTVIYFALLVGIRLTGARQLGQMSTFDLVLLLIIANAVQNAMVGPDTSLAGGLVAAAVLLIWHGVVDRIRRRSRGLAKFLSGEGIMLINHGAISVIRNDDLKPGVWPHHRIKAVKRGSAS